MSQISTNQGRATEPFELSAIDIVGLRFNENARLTVEEIRSQPTKQSFPSNSRLFADTRRRGKRFKSLNFGAFDMDIKQLVISAFLLIASVTTVSFAQEIPEPELPSLVDQNLINVATGNISLSHSSGTIGPAREELRQGLKYNPSGLQFSASISPRDSQEDFSIFYNDDDNTYSVASESVKIRFYFSYLTGEFTPVENTFATLENVAGDENFTDLIYTTENGTVLTFEATAQPAYQASQRMASLKKIERPDGEIWTSERVNFAGGTTAIRNGFKSNNLGYSSYPYLTNLGYTRCERVQCAEYNPANWPDKSHNPPPSISLHEQITQTVDVGGGDQISLSRWTYGRIDYFNGDSLRANFDMNFTLGTSVTPNPEARVQSVERYGSIWSYEYDDTPQISPHPGAHITTITAPDGSKERFHYDPETSKIIQYDLVPSSGGSDLSTVYEYLDERLISVTYPEGNKTEFNRDAFGRVLEVRKKSKPGQSLPDMVMSYTYDLCDASNRKYCAKPRTSTDESGNATKFTYSPQHGGITEVQSPFVTGLGFHKTITEYQPFHAWYRTSDSTVQVRDERPVWRKTKEISCVVASELATCVDSGADVQVVEYQYEQGNASTPSNIKLESITTRAGDSSVSSTISYTYDTWGRVKSEDGPLPGTADTIWYEYDNRNNKTRETLSDPDGSGPQRYMYTRWEYNLEDQVTREESGWTTSNSSTTGSDTVLTSMIYAYDAFGRQRSKTSLASDSGSVSLVQTSYDSSSRVDCTALRMSPSTYGGLPTSACTQTSNGNDRITQAQYDTYGRASRTVRGYGTSVQMAEEETFTPNGLRHTIKDGKNNLTTYEYDGHDRLSKTRFPNVSGTGSSTTDFEEFTYVTANGQSTPLRFGHRHRDGQWINFTYDALNRVELADAPGTVDDVATTYDVFGNIRTLEKDSLTLTSNRDALGRLTSEQSELGTVSYAYDAAGRRTRMNYPSGLFTAYEFTGSGGIDKIKENDVATVVDFDYDAFHRPILLTRGNGNTSTIGFDSANRVNSLDFGLPADASYDQEVDFTFNPAGQITSKAVSNSSYFPSISTSTAIYALNGLNQIESENSTSFTYDARGNLIDDGVATYAYNIFNQLTNVSTGSSFRFDPAGRLYEIIDGSGNTTKFLYDGSVPIAEYDGNNQLLRQYLHGPTPDAPLVWYEGTQINASSLRHLVPDERGSIVLISDANGEVVQRNRYDVYGIPDNANLGRFQYTGQIWLQEAQLYHYKARTYNPRLGRFMQTDPIGYADGLNWYAYVGNDPINVSDPTGTCGWGAASTRIGPCGFLRDVGRDFSDGLFNRTTRVTNSLRGRSDGAWRTGRYIGTVLGKSSGPAASVIDLANSPISPGPDITLAVAMLKNADNVAPRTYHRYQSPSQTIEVGQLQVRSREIWGAEPRNTFASDVPQVQAFEGPLPPGRKGVEFTTTTPPSKVNFLSGEARWRGDRPDIETRTVDGEDFAVIKCQTVTQVPDC